jgi:CheY-like chemotaxis protein
MLSFQTNRVLIIDDNDIDNFITQRVLNKENFTKQVDICTSGAEALDYIKKHSHNLDQLPDVIFLDLNMPVVDGFVFLFEFEDFSQAVKNKCKIVVLSSLLDKLAIDKVLRNESVTDFIPKPLTQSALQRLALVREKV